MTLTGTRGGAWLGGGASYSCGVLRWVHLLLVRSRLVHLLPFGGGRPLLWCRGPRLVDARSGGCSWLTSCPASSTDTSSCQQVLQGGGWKRVHRFKWRHSWWRVTWLHSSSLEVSIRLMPDREPGEGHRSTDTFGRLQSRSSSIGPKSSPPVGSTHPPYLPVGSSPPPQEAISCQR